METIVGTVENITFRAEDTGYTVLRIQPEDSPAASLITAVGNFPAVSAGETLRLLGEWTTHPKYGRQLRVHSFQQVTPATITGIKKYLGSGLIKGIGPVTAERLVDHFGQQTLRIISEEPGRLTEVEGIGPQKAARISQALQQQRDIQEVMVFLQGHGVNPALASKVYRKYGVEAIEIVRENPYRLATEITGVGFKTADRIAQSLGWQPDAKPRVKAGLSFVLRQAAGEGHTCLPVEEFIEKAAALLSVDSGLVAGCLQEGVPGVEVTAGGTGESVYLQSLLTAEKGSARKLKTLTAAVTMPLLPGTVELEIEEIERDMEITLSSGQKAAVKAAHNHGVCVITGGPGTGKTTIIRAVVELFQRRGLKVALAAPTGRAAKRLAQATSMEASTIHRLLEYTAEGGRMRFARDEENPIPADAVIIDEVSMLDIVLAYHLLKAIRPGARLVLVGDVDQLPSVGPGRVLEDLIASGVVQVVRLNEVFRQARESTIVVNAHRINRGQLPVASRDKKDFFFLEEAEPEKMATTVAQLVTARLPDFTGCRPRDDIQVLTPVKRGPLGTISLNETLQGLLNPNPGPGLKYGATRFYPGDKVMQVRNNYHKDVYNGDLGFVREVDPEEGEMTVAFPDVPAEHLVHYDLGELDELVLAYAVSVHKSQGSEYPIVVIPVFWIMPALMTRNLLYTAVTRARQLVVLVGDKRALAAYVRNKRSGQRHTRLAERLQGLID